MTEAEFDRTRWHANMYTLVGGKVVSIVGVDFENKTVDIEGHGWVGCALIKLVDSNYQEAK